MRHVFVSALIITLAILASPAHASDPEAGRYTWNGEFVSYDQATGTLTVKSRIAYPDAASAVNRFKPGDRVLLHWSGFDVYADAIREVVSYDEPRLAKEQFLFPAELVSTETPNQYVTFRFHIPSGASVEIGSLKAGDWITVTSRHRPAAAGEAVTEVRPFAASNVKASTTN